LFGIKVEVVVLVWNEVVLHQQVDKGHKFEFLLWSLYFLKNNNTEEVMGTNSEVATKTMRKWIWRTLQSICEIQVESLPGYSKTINLKCTVTNLFFDFRLIGKIGL
jgi:hypothetical protein